MDYTKEDFKRELARLEKLAKDGALNDIGLGKLEMANSVENLILPVVSGSATTITGLTKEGTTDTTIWRGGWVTDNFETYYLDEKMVKHYR